MTQLPPLASFFFGWVGTDAIKPDATTLPDNTRYLATDTEAEWAVISGAWVALTGGGGGGITSWGGAATATFSGTGSPVGVVTPSAKGDLYIDKSTPNLWQADGLTNADWELVGAGGTFILTVSDGTTSVSPVTEIDFIGAIVSDEGGGGAQVNASWGRAPGAYYGNAGSPVGVVPPGAVGDLYVDTTGPGLWQATGLGSSDWTQVGSGTGGDWGEASTAHFSGSGDPTGIVTPNGAGDLYVDVTTPALWQANGTGSSDWQQLGITGWGLATQSFFSGTGSPVGVVTSNSVGDLYVDSSTPNLWQATSNGGTTWQQVGGSATIQIAVLGGGISSQAPSGGGEGMDANAQTVIPVDAIGQEYGTWEASTVIPLQTYAAGVIGSYGSLSVGSINTTNDQYGIGITILVQDEDGSESMELDGDATTTGGAPFDGVTLLPTALSATAVTGADLSYDPTSGEISSAAGGNYVMVADMLGAWQ